MKNRFKELVINQIYHLTRFFCSILLQKNLVEPNKPSLRNKGLQCGVIFRFNMSEINNSYSDLSLEYIRHGRKMKKHVSLSENIREDV